MADLAESIDRFSAAALRVVALSEKHQSIGALGAALGLDPTAFAAICSSYLVTLHEPLAEKNVAALIAVGIQLERLRWEQS